MPQKHPFFPKSLLGSNQGSQQALGSSTCRFLSSKFARSCDSSLEKSRQAPPDCRGRQYPHSMPIGNPPNYPNDFHYSISWRVHRYNLDTNSLSNIDIHLETTIAELGVFEYGPLTHCAGLRQLLGNIFGYYMPVSILYTLKIWHHCLRGQIMSSIPSYRTVMTPLYGIWTHDLKHLRHSSSKATANHVALLVQPCHTPRYSEAANVSSQHRKTIHLTL